jgi:hypothetical protein
MVSCSLKVELDVSILQPSIFNSITSISIDKEQMFSYGVMVEEAPKKIKESDFEYLQSKIPALKSLLEDFLEIRSKRIVNKSNDDRKKVILSEFIGVGVGLFYAKNLFNLNPNRIKKLPRPNRRVPYLDYSAISRNKKLEIELKGTTYESKIANLITKCLSKKSASQNTAQKFGVITLIRKEGEIRDSKIVVCDDPEDNNKVDVREEIDTILEHYLPVLSFTLKPRDYNEFRRVLGINKDKIKELQLIPKAFKHQVLYDGKKFLGGFFDKRLISENILKFSGEHGNFELLTSKLGKVKYFLGIDEQIIDIINNKNYSKLLEYNSSEKVIENENGSVSITSDGVIFIKTTKGFNKEVEEKYTEKEVERIFNLFFKYLKRSPHYCGAPCRSKSREGRPCRIKTYGDRCHFHR